MSDEIIQITQLYLCFEYGLCGRDNLDWIMINKIPISFKLESRQNITRLVYVRTPDEISILSKTPIRLFAQYTPFDVVVDKQSNIYDHISRAIRVKIRRNHIEENDNIAIDTFNLIQAKIRGYS